nr:MAG TPA: hypothetical protein [Caudoviricetes sp.]
MLFLYKLIYTNTLSNLFSSVLQVLLLSLQ